MRLTGFTEKAAKGLEAHHVLPIALEKDFKRVFGNGLNIHDPKWAAWVQQGTHQKWGYEYQKEWERWLSDNPKANLDQLEDFARKLGNDPKYNFQVIY